jgi:hypothetical protein
LQQNPTKRANNTATEYGTAEGLSLDIFNFQVGRSEIGVKFHPKKKLLAAKPRIQTIAGDESSETAHYHPTIPELTILCTRKAPDPIPKHPLKFPKKVRTLQNPLLNQLLSNERY